MTETNIIVFAACGHGYTKNGLNHLQLHGRNTMSSLASVLFILRCIKLLLNLGYLLCTSAESIEQLLLCVSTHSSLSLSPRCLSHAYWLCVLFSGCQRGQKRLYAQNGLSKCFSATTHFNICLSFCLFTLCSVSNCVGMLWLSAHNEQICESFWSCEVTVGFICCMTCKCPGLKYQFLIPLQVDQRLSD